MIVIAMVVVVGAAFVVGGLIGSGLTNAMRDSRRRGLSAPRPGGFPERRRHPVRVDTLIDLDPVVEPIEEPPEVVSSERIAL